ncbi:hypothetical protein IV487_04615 [Enterococcus saccharolyticus]|uniref:ABC transporter permease n=1 Tax=Candidatus Enterococcus willemsii TaxID=1857215 RepID=A0ABQ6YZ74_9ENTE|nr:MULTISPECIES: hypothetical protein [Enterococcus]KAF1303281.1 hypothetical protein BAU17_08625 [Enterococcus sp. CU12B]MCD5001753.1 hypothetical protein [Enterococcus saccharolyticus]
MKMIRSLYYQRYGKSLIALMLIFFGLYLYNGIGGVRAWQNEYDYLHSKEFVTSDYYNHEWNIKDYDDNNKPIYYESIDDYRNERLMTYTYSENFYSTYAEMNATSNYNPEIAVAEPTYQAGNVYYSYYVSSQPWALLIFILGFLLFFVDQKTNFNRFLFSLSVSRKKLFTGKLLYLAGPFMLVIGLGILGNILIQWYGIPQLYMNATVIQLLQSGLSHWIFTIFLLCSGMLLGVTLGNVVFGPLSILLGLFVLSQMTVFSFFSNLNIILTYFFPDIQLPMTDAIFVVWPGKTSTPWYISLILMLLSALFIFLAERIFRKVSIEDDGDYVTSPGLRLPVFLTMFVSTCFFFTITMTSWYLVFNPVEDYTIIRELIIITIVTCICSYILVYARSIRKWWIARRDNYLQRKSS